MKIYIFDLDETIINSRHRTPNNPDGTLNLAAYMASHTPENVARDTLLPLARFMQKLHRQGAKIWILTARDMKQCDYEYLQRNGIIASKIMSRDKVRHKSHYNLRDGCYKKRWIRPLMNLRQFTKTHFIMFDDAASVLTAMRAIGITALNAVTINQKLERG